MKLPLSFIMTKAEKWEFIVLLNDINFKMPILIKILFPQYKKCRSGGLSFIYVSTNNAKYIWLQVGYFIV